MELEKLFAMQRELDSHIEEKHQLQDEDLFNRKVLALLVELGELANETRAFKFWSVKPSAPKDIILMEFVDGLHFILSLGIECGFEKAGFELEVVGETDAAVTEQFLAIFGLVHRFQVSKSLADYTGLFEAFLQLGGLLGISEFEMVEAYFKKNEVNYQRQADNY